MTLASLATGTRFSALYLCESGQTISTKKISVAQRMHLSILEEKVLQKRKPLVLPSVTDSLLPAIQNIKTVPKFRFYAGFPLESSDGRLIGVFSVLDKSPLFLTRKQRTILRNMALQIAGLCEKEAACHDTEKSYAFPQAKENRLIDHFQHAQHLLRAASWEFNQEAGEIFWSPEVHGILGSHAQNLANTFEEFISYVHPDDRVAVILAQERFIHHGLPFAIRHRIICPNGQMITVLNLGEVIKRGERDEEYFVGALINLSENPVSKALLGDIQEPNPMDIEASDEKNYFRAMFEASPEPYIVLTPDDYRIVAANQARLTVTRTRREDIIGRKLFDLFPDDPNDPSATGVKNLRASLERVKQRREIDIMPVQRYPIRMPEEEGGEFVERYWTPVNSPVLNEDGSIACIIHRVEDVTEYIQSKKTIGPGEDSEGHGIEGISAMEADIVLRSIELKQLAEKAKESERRYRSAFTNSLVGMSVATLDGTLVDCNDRLAEMTGYTKDELSRIKIRDLTHPDDWSENKKLLEELMQGRRKAFEIKKRYLHKSGKIVWVLNYVSMIFDSKAQPYRLYAVIIDITEEQNAKQELLQHEELLRIGERMAHVGSWSYDLDGKGRWHGSDELYRVHGLSPAMPLSFEEIAEYFVPHSKELFKTAHDACLRTGKSFDFEAEIRNASGDPVWIRILGEAKRNQEGGIVGTHGAYLDISKSKESEATLREQAALLDAATDAIIVRSLEDRILYWNRAAERQYGWTAQEVLGRPVKSVLYSQSAVPFEVALEKLKRDGDFSGQITHLRKDGSKVIVQSHWTLVRHDDGSPKSILAIHTDITDRIDMEQKMAQMQKLNALGQLTGGIAHDFNNLLTVINGSAEILTEEFNDPSLCRELAHTIFLAGERGAQLTSRLLAFARRQELEPDVVDLCAVVNSMRGMLQRSLGEQMRLSMHYAEVVWPVYIDEAQFESALLNLCINARDAMPKGGTVKIEISNAILDERYVEKNPDAKPGDYVMLAVSDTGVGMTQETVSRAFEPFFTTKGRGQGSGLGLSMVYGFIAQSNGHIKIESSPGQGTVVRMYFPRAFAEVLAAPDAEVPGARGAIQGGAESILLVEDNELVRAHGKKVLEELGYRVQVASDGHEALALLQDGARYDLLFTDILMPHGIGGFLLAEKALSFCPDMRVLFTTGYSDSAESGIGEEPMGFPVLRKPYRRQTLAAQVRKALHSRRRP
ncbi:MAG: PAS domain S-box protein [Burkholderiaceae bacterium]